MADPTTIEISLQTAISLIIIGIPTAYAIFRLVKLLKSDPQDGIKKQVNDLNTDIKSLEKDIRNIKNDLDKLSETTDKLSTQNLNHDLIKSQMEDFKITINRLQDKIEKITDLIIKLVTKD